MKKLLSFENRSVFGEFYLGIHKKEVFLELVSSVGAGHFDITKNFDSDIDALKYFENKVDSLKNDGWKLIKEQEYETR